MFSYVLGAYKQKIKDIDVTQTNQTIRSYFVYYGK